MTRVNSPFVLPLPLILLVAIAAMSGSGCSKPPAEPPAKPASPAGAADPEATNGIAKEAPAEHATGKEPVTEPATPGDGLSELITTLTTTDDSRTRVITTDAIAMRRRAALPALDALVAALDDPEPRVRWHAARAIGLIGHEAASAIPALVKQLSDEDPVTVTQTASAIGHIRRDDDREDIPAEDAAFYAAAVEPLVGVMVHPDPRARRAAVRAIREVSTSRDHLLTIVRRHLADADPMAVMPALHTLADMGKDAVPLLIEALQNPSSRFWAEVVLGEIGPDAAAAAEPLAKLVQEGAIEDQVQSMLALARLGDAAKVAAPQLIAALESPDASLRYVAAYALGQLRVSEGDAALEAASTSDDPFLVTLASWARARIHPEDAELRSLAVERLTAAVASESPDVRRAGVEGLSELDDSLDQTQRLRIADTFAGMLNDPDPEVSLAAGAGLIRLGSDAVEALVTTLDKPDVRQAGMEILAEMGPAARPALDQMIAGLTDADPVFRADSALALGALGAEAKDAVAPLASILADESAPPGVRYTAAYALGKIGPDALAAEPLLRKLADSADELMATVAVWAALNMRPDDTSLYEAAIPKLRHTLTQERELARLEAAVALGEIGPPAASALPLLEMLAEEDPSRNVRAAAAAAVNQIREPD